MAHHEIRRQAGSVFVTDKNWTDLVKDLRDTWK